MLNPIFSGGCSHLTGLGFARGGSKEFPMPEGPSIVILKELVQPYRGADVMNDKWDPRKARIKLKELPDMLVCDALLNQEIFAGVGNIIKNEVLFRIRVHPESKVGALPSRKLGEMIKEARNYSFDKDPTSWKGEETGFFL